MNGRQTIGRPMVALQDQPDTVAAIVAVLESAAGHVCGTCGLERMGHGPESRWLGYKAHPWHGVPADGAALERARQLTADAYRARA